MSEITLTKVSYDNAADIISLYEPEEEISSLVNDTTSPAGLVSQLMQNRHYSEALQFMFYALPKREAVWLACMIYDEHPCSENNTPESEAIKLAKEWVFSPDEEHRLAAMQHAESSNYSTPESFVAAGVAWSSGSLSGPDHPAVPPADDLTAKALWASVMVHIYQFDPETIPEKFHTFLDQAIDIANGGSGRMSQP